MNKGSLRLLAPIGKGTGSTWSTTAHWRVVKSPAVGGRSTSSPTGRTYAVGVADSPAVS